MPQEETMNRQIPIDPAKGHLVRQYLEKFLFSDVKQKSDDQMWTHFSFNERPQRSEIVFNSKFLDDCKNLEEIMENSIMPLLIANPGKSIIVGELGGLSVEDRNKG